MQFFLHWTFISILGLSCGQTVPFDAREATVSSVQTAIFSGQTTCRAVVSTFLARIEAHNPLINAIITLNPDALSIADSLDDSLAAGNATGPLYCVPILLKDNYDAFSHAYYRRLYCTQCFDPGSGWTSGCRASSCWGRHSGQIQSSRTRSRRSRCILSWRADPQSL